MRTVVFCDICRSRFGTSRKRHLRDPRTNRYVGSVCWECDGLFFPQSRRISDPMLLGMVRYLKKKRKERWPEWATAFWRMDVPRRRSWPSARHPVGLMAELE